MQTPGARGFAAPLLSIIVCTLNRADNLAQCLASLMHQSITADAYEILVVDNGSSDRSVARVESLGDDYSGRLSCWRCSRPGLSRARNLGIEKARAPLLAFIDDDARADVHWVRALVAAFRRLPAAAALGGPVKPAGASGLPSWFTCKMQSYLSLVDYGPTSKWLHYPNYPFGTNMAFRGDIFARIGKFDRSLGRKGPGSMRCGEETEVFQRMERSGYRIAWIPSAIVFHAIDEARLTVAGLCRQARHSGRVLAELDRRQYSPRFLALKKLLLRAAVIMLRITNSVGAGCKLKSHTGCLLAEKTGYLEVSR